MRSRIGKRIAIGVGSSLLLILLLGIVNLIFTRTLIQVTQQQHIAYEFRSQLVATAAELVALKSAEATATNHAGASAVPILKERIKQLDSSIAAIDATFGINPRILFEASKQGRFLKERITLTEALVASLQAGGETIAEIRAKAAEMDQSSGIEEKLQELIHSVDDLIEDLRDRSSRVANVSYVFTWIGIFVACSAVAYGGYRITRAVTTPINSLIEGVEKVREEEDLGYRIPVTSSDETGRLTEEFNRLLDRLDTADRRQKELYEVVNNTNTELKEFAYVISHDLKAPLRGIASLSSWLTTDYHAKIDDDGKEILSLLTARVQRMHDLIDGVLQYSRAGRQKEQMVETDLNRVVEDAIELVSAPDSMKITIQNRLPTIFCEPTRITQVFQNLLSNAVKYMDKPEGVVRISSEDAGRNWRFSVEDNGPGIDPKYHDKIFQIFQTLRSGEDYDSTGIGLSVVKKIIRLYGGAIRVESELGRGAKFVFELPKQAYHVMDVI